jgi:hypothetical protein
MVQVCNVTDTQSNATYFSVKTEIKNPTEKLSFAHVTSAAVNTDSNNENESGSG